MDRGVKVRPGFLTSIPVQQANPYDCPTCRQAKARFENPQSQPPVLCPRHGEMTSERREIMALITLIDRMDEVLSALDSSDDVQPLAWHPNG